jgi:asparagine synthase (glutamine-hydrolysing)
MCGIAGWIGQVEEAGRQAEILADSMRHRGPDASGIRQFRQAALVHTRLSIIDLSEAGAQPMANEDGTVWTVFNGEIYNHRDLRRDLESRGHFFRGRSDGEVLPHLYEEYGSGFVSLLRGMFALAIYDTRSGELLLARDRFGIKPLFYAPGDDKLAFASEIAPLLRLPFVDARPNRQAVYDFASLFFIPAPDTFYSDIKALMPGEILQAKLNSTGLFRECRSYHRWALAPDSSINLSSAVERAGELLNQAVIRQLESDVPLGCLLSGGIDSSLVACAARPILNGNLRTFNVQFPDRAYDETWAAESVAASIGSRHQVLPFHAGSGTWEHVTDLLKHAGQPFADTSFFAANAICRAMRPHVTVALSGDGGDEAFGGYNYYHYIDSIVRVQRLPKLLLRFGTSILNGMAACSAVPGRLAGHVRSIACADDTEIIQYLLSWIRQPEHSKLCRDRNMLPVSRHFQKMWDHRLEPGASRLERLSAYASEVTIRMLLPNDFLYKVDMASMKESLEIRVPMLDEDFFEFGLTIPHSLKVEGKNCKRVLRALAARKLPEPVAKKPKWGFGVPVDTWVDDDFKIKMREALAGPSSHLSEFFEPSVYLPFVDAFCNGSTHPGISRQGIHQRIMMLLSVELAMNRKASVN